MLPLLFYTAPAKHLCVPILTDGGHFHRKLIRRWTMEQPSLHQLPSLKVLTFHFCSTSASEARVNSRLVKSDFGSSPRRLHVHGHRNRVLGASSPIDTRALSFSTLRLPMKLICRYPIFSSPRVHLNIPLYPLPWCTCPLTVSEVKFLV